MKQEKIDQLLDRIHSSAHHVQTPESLEPERMMEQLHGTTKTSHGWKRPVKYGAIAAAAILAVVTTVQLQHAGVAQRMPVPAETGAEKTVLSETDEASPYTAKSYEEIFDHLRRNRPVTNGYKSDMVVKEGAAAGADSAAPMEGPAEDIGFGAMEEQLQNNGSFSGTNVQVQGVDEGDVVKTDGTYLYILSEYTGSIRFVQVDGSEMKVCGMLEDTSTVKEARKIQEFYINGDRLSVIRQGYKEADARVNYSVDISEWPMIEKNYVSTPVKDITYLETYDIRDKEHPVLLGTLTQDGRYKSSRRVDDYVYLFTEHYAYEIGKKSDPGSYIPLINQKPIPYDDIYIPEQVSGSGYVVISAVDMKKPEETADAKAVLADGGHFYVSSSGIYIGSPQQDWEASQYDYTELLKLNYKNGTITFQAHTNVDGYLNDQFSMDEYRGNLRLVTTLSHQGGNQTNSLIVLDEKLNQIGEIEDLAPGEQVYSARFMGDVGYFVTFRQMDPLFSVDLSNPSNPNILGELKITGFSQYLHPYQNDLLLGIGQEISPDTGNFKGLKLSMFDVTDPKNVQEVKKMVEQSFESSPAWGNHKAVTISADKNIIGFAVDVYDSNKRTWAQQYVVYSYDETEGFYKEMAYPLMEGGDIGAVRGFYIGSWFYVVENRRVTAFRLGDFGEVGVLEY